MSTRKLLIAVWCATSALSVVAADRIQTTGAMEKPKRLAFDTLKKWTYIEGKTKIPDFIQKLDGQVVEMTGYMSAPDTADDIHDFVLVPSLWGCCYGQPPVPNHVVLVKVRKGLKTAYYEKPLIVRGRFRVGEERIEGDLISLYRLEADEIKIK